MVVGTRLGKLRFDESQVVGERDVREQHVHSVRGTVTPYWSQTSRGSSLFMSAKCSSAIGSWRRANGFRSSVIRGPSGASASTSHFSKERRIVSQVEFSNVAFSGIVKSIAESDAKKS